MPGPEEEAADILDPLLATFRARLQATILNHAVTAYLRGSAQMEEFGRTLTTKRPIYFEGPPMQQAINFANRQAAQAVTKIDQETKDILKKIIGDGIKDKRGIDGLARDIRNQFKDWQRTDEMTVSRSRLIARTETNAALSEGSFQRGKAMGVNGKSWLTVGDDRVRASHRENEAAGVIPYDKPFPSGDMHPPGVDGYNCRCVLVPEMLPEK